MAQAKTEWIVELVNHISGPINQVSSSVEKVDYAIDALTASVNILGDRIESSFKKADDGAKKANKSLSLMAAQAGSDALQNLGQPFLDGANATYAYNTALTELEAITGVTGPALNDIGEGARKTAKDLGGDAAAAVSSYTVLLSKLTPEIAKNPKALEMMGNSVGLLAETMKNDLPGATNSAAAVMNQFGIDMEDPIAAAQAMDRMLNQMVASAKVGSQDVPVVARAIEEVGAVAKNAKVEFGETNAALQVLGKYGKEGAEGGIALRNVLSILQKEEFLPKEVLEQLQGAGVDINVLSDKSLSLADRLTELKKLGGDDALLGAMFGQENSVAIAALLGNLDLMRQYTKDINADETALADMAETMGKSYQEQKDRIVSFFDDIKLSIYGATGSMLPFIDVGLQGVLGIISLAPGIMATAQMFQLLGSSTMFTAVASKVAAAATWLWNAALSANPIVWIVGIIIGLIAAIIWAYTEFDEFRAVIDGLGETFMVVFDSIWKYIKLLMTPIRLIVGFVTDGVDGFNAAKDAIAADAKGLVNNVKDIASGDAFMRGYDESMAESAAKNKEGDTPAVGTVPGGTATPSLDGTLTNPTAKSGTEISGAGGGKSVIMTVNVTNNFKSVSSELDLRKISQKINDGVVDKLRDTLLTV